jgi:hypothetical protein
MARNLGQDAAILRERHGDHLAVDVRIHGVKELPAGLEWMIPADVENPETGVKVGDTLPIGIHQPGSLSRFVVALETDDLKDSHKLGIDASGVQVVCFK